MNAKPTLTENDILTQRRLIKVLIRQFTDNPHNENNYPSECAVLRTYLEDGSSLDDAISLMKSIVSQTPA